MLVVIRRLGVVVAVVLASIWVTAAPAAAIEQTSESPQDGSRVQPPGSVRVVHDSPVNPAGSSIEVKNKNGNLVDGATSFATTLVPGDTIVFTPTFTLTEAGSRYDVHSFAVGLDLDTAETNFVFFVDTTPPLAPTVTDLTDPVNAGNQAAMRVAGTAEPGSTVNVFVRDGTDQSTAQVPAGAGAYSADLDVTALADGALEVVVIAVDEAGNASPSGTDAAFKDAGVPAAPGVTIVEDPIDGSNQGAVTITGTSAEAGLTIDVSVDDDGNASTAPITASTTNAGDGTWTVEDLNLSTLAQGLITATATATDAAGNESANGTDTATKELGPPVLLSISPEDGSTGQAPVAITAIYGEALDVDNSTITVRDNTLAGMAGETTFGADNTSITFTPSAELTQSGSPYTVTLAVEDVANQPESPATETTFTVIDVDFVSVPQTVNGMYIPLRGDYDDDGNSDIFWYSPGTVGDPMWLSDGDGTYTVTTRSVSGTYTPILGDFGGDFATDIFWYAPGSAADFLWISNGNGTFTSVPTSVSGTYTPITGDYDGDTYDDIFWYQPGPGADFVWFSHGDGDFTSIARNVTGTYTPITGDHDADGDTDIFWYQPGTGADFLWLSEGDGTFTSAAQTVNGSHTPITGDVNGDTFDDIFWYSPGTASDVLWLSEGDGTFTSIARNVTGTYTPITGDHDADGDTDIFWYQPGTGADFLWRAIVT